MARPSGEVAQNRENYDPHAHCFNVRKKAFSTVSAMGGYHDAILERWYNSNRYFYFFAISLRSHEASFALRPAASKRQETASAPAPAVPKQSASASASRCRSRLSEILGPCL
jgi:hypothetical protein